MDPDVDPLGADFPEALDLTNRDVDFDQMEQDIEKFASEPSVREVLEEGVDLQNYSGRIAKDLELAESASIDDYLSQTPRVEQLHREIMACDAALEAMENLLLQFKGSLGQLSTDIFSLQTRSQEINVKLLNRKALEKFLGEFTREVSVTRDFENKISTTEVGFAYVKLLEELSRKLKYLLRKEVRASHAGQEAVSPLDRLRVRAADNVRKWIVARVTDFRTGVQDRLSVQNLMMRCRFLFRFLREHAPDVQQASLDYYVEVVSRIFLDQYRSATNRIAKQMAQISMAPETIVPVRSSRKNRPGESTLFFSLGERAKLVAEILAPPQDFPGDSYPLEALLRALYQTLIDDVTSEHSFVSEFFEDDNVSIGIFAPTTKFLEQYLEELLARITDPVCVILLLRFAYAQKAEMERRRIFKIDQHLTAVQHKLVDRFRAIIAINQAALEAADGRRFLESEATAHHANAMTRRFAEFSTSLSLLLVDELAELMTPELHMIAAAVIDLLEKTSRELPGPDIAAVFLINNYYLVVASLRQLNGCVLTELFDQKLADCTAHYIDLELSKAFKRLVETVRRAFSKLETREEPHSVGIGESELKEIALEFRASHVEKMKGIAEAQLLRFGDFVNGKRILGLLAKRLVLYWTKFEQLCKAVTKNGPNPQWFASLISVQQLVCNIRPLTDTGF
jgi:hypothetical protein